MSQKALYLKGLNGLRAIAALSVMLGHITSRTFINYNFNLPVFNVGYYGVTLFFTISGFLITLLLILEKEKTKIINIKKFYIRRILRIWPLYYFFIIICTIVAVFFHDLRDIYSLNLFYYVFFLANIPIIFQFPITIIGHYWSIGVEEQFYIIWPLMMKILNKNLLYILFGLILALFVVKMMVWSHYGNQSIFYRALSFNRFHCMLIGCVGAFIYKYNYYNFANLIANRFFQLIIWLVFIIVFIGIFELPVTISAEVMATLSVFLIIGQAEESNFKIFNLDHIIFDKIGKISYGIYVYHPLLIFLFGKLLINVCYNNILQYIVVYLSISLTTLLFAYVSYEYLEKRFLIVKSRFAIIPSSSSK